MPFKKLLTSVLLAATPMVGWADGISLSITLGDPGYYGRLNVHSMPAPRLVYPEPVIVEHVHIDEPLYLHVPSYHVANWQRHCHIYDACARRVYFVDSGWYESVYVPAYRHRHHHKSRGHGGHKRWKGKSARKFKHKGKHKHR